MNIKKFKWVVVSTPTLKYSSRKRGIVQCVVDRGVLLPPWAMMEDYLLSETWGTHKKDLGRLSSVFPSVPFCILSGNTRTNIHYTEEYLGGHAIQPKTFAAYEPSHHKNELLFHPEAMGMVEARAWEVLRDWVLDHDSKHPIAKLLEH